MLHTAILGFRSCRVCTSLERLIRSGASGCDQVVIDSGTDWVASQKAAVGEEMMQEIFGLRPSPPQRNPSWSGSDNEKWCPGALEEW